MTRFTLEEIGDETAKSYQIQFSDQVLAEATVGAVLRCSLVLPGEENRTDAVVKIIKRQAVSAMREELAIFDQLTQYFAAHRETYEIGAIPISETFENVREALSKEIVIVEEQKKSGEGGGLLSRQSEGAGAETLPPLDRSCHLHGVRPW